MTVTSHESSIILSGARGELREAWQDPNTWEAALAECRARYPLQAVAIDGAIWTFLDTGAGAGTLLLLPGAMGFADTSFHFVLAFAPVMRVLSLSYPASHTDGDRLVDELAELLTARGIGAAHVVGGSYSGLVAQRLAERHPQRVHSLILANTWAADPRRVRVFRPAAWVLARLPARLIQQFLTTYLGHFLPGADPAAHFWRGYFRTILPAFTPALIACRLHTFASLDAADWPLAPSWLGQVLLVESSDDRLFGTTSQQALRLRYPTAQAVQLACPGHAAALTQVATYVMVYQQWVKTVVSGADTGS